MADDEKPIATMEVHHMTGEPSDVADLIQNLCAVMELDYVLVVGDPETDHAVVAGNVDPPQMIKALETAIKQIKEKGMH